MKARLIHAFFFLEDSFLENGIGDIIPNEMIVFISDRNEIL